MTVKAQFNPSTGLMHFTAATKKVQVVAAVGGPCDRCPGDSTIQVTIADALGRTCYEYPDFLNLFNSTTGDWESIINDTHELTAAQPGPTCQWTKHIDVAGQGLRWETWSVGNDPCNGDPDDFLVVTGFVIDAVIITPGTTINIDVGYFFFFSEQPVHVISFSTTLNPPIGECLENGPYNLPFIPKSVDIMTGGTCTVGES